MIKIRLFLYDFYPIECTERLITFVNPKPAIMKKLLTLSIVFIFTFSSRGQIVFHENFDAPSLGDSVSTIFNGLHGFAQNSRLGLYAGDFCDSAFIDISDSIILETNAFSTLGMDTVYFTFKHICKVDYLDVAKLYASNDNGQTWVQLTGEYLTNWLCPPGAPFAAQGNLFSAGSYPVWNPGNPSAVPDTNWWRYEFFDLSALIGNVSQAKIRWVMKDDNFPGGNGNAGWYIDDIQVGMLSYVSPINMNFNYVTPICVIPLTVNFNFHHTGLNYFNNSDSLFLHLFFGDGNDTIVSMAFLPNGNFSCHIPHTYLLPGSFIPFVDITSNFGFSNSFTLPAIQVSNNCITLSGKLFMDNNADCIFNTGDEPILYRRVGLWNNNQLLKSAYTDNSGGYSMQIDTSAMPFDVKAPVLTSHNLSFTCPSNGIQTINSGSGTLTADFAYLCSPGFDLYIFGLYMVRAITGGGAKVYVINSFCQSVASVAKQWIENKLSINQTIPPYNFTNADTMYWNFNSIHMNTNPIYGNRFFVHGAPTLPLASGDSVDFYTEIEPIPGETNTANNSYFIRVPVLTSYDPNDKAVFPEGNISPSQELTYMIRFQNTGNDTAYNIFVLDTISPLLDMNTMNIISASHEMSIDVVANNVLKFNFYNIMLPDSVANEPLSHGFILYSVKPMPGLTHGTEIKNRAHIYFDWNPPITTNTTISMIDSALTVSVQLVASAQSVFSIYPNPAQNEVTVFIPEFSEGEYQYAIHDAVGRMVQKGELNAQRQTLPVLSFANGVYHFQVSGKHSGVMVKKMVIMKE